MVNLPTHETRGARYVALLRERFGPDAADRVADDLSVPCPYDPEHCVLSCARCDQRFAAGFR